MYNKNELDTISLEIRKDIYKMVCRNHAGHLASSLSAVDILVALYFNGILQYDSQNPDWDMRDRFILSKGHAALAYYFVLARAGYYDVNQVSTFCQEGTVFGGLATAGKIPGIEATTGSLGHGLSVAAGKAYSIKHLSKTKARVFCLLGDGELQEGENWEAAMFITHNNLDNLTIIVDNNEIQATGFQKDILSLNHLAGKWEAFGFDVDNVDGHDILAISELCKKEDTRPRVVIAHTVKGKGLSFVENKQDWHYKMPSKEEILIGCRELGIDEGELVDYAK